MRFEYWLILEFVGLVLSSIAAGLLWWSPKTRETWGTPRKALLYAVVLVIIAAHILLKGFTGKGIEDRVAEAATDGVCAIVEVQPCADRRAKEVAQLIRGYQYVGSITRAQTSNPKRTRSEVWHIPVPFDFKVTKASIYREGQLVVELEIDGTLVEADRFEGKTRAIGTRAGAFRYLPDNISLKGWDPLKISISDPVTKSQGEGELRRCVQLEGVTFTATDVIGCASEGASFFERLFGPSSGPPSAVSSK